MHRTRHLVLAAAVLAGCGPGRTAPATQPTPAAFDPAGSDPRALKIADEVIAAAGGEEAWAKAREISWTQTLELDGKRQMLYKHDWDRWDGRHGLWQEANGNGFHVMYELFGGGGGIGFVVKDGDEKNTGQGVLQSGDRKDAIAKARVRWAEDAYMIALPFKLKDPGVHLKWIEELPEVDGGPPVFDVVRVTFERGVGRDTHYVVVRKDNHLIDRVETTKDGAGGGQRIGFRWSDWTEAGGLKIAQKRVNLGYEGQVITISDVKVSASVEEDHYVPAVY